MRSSRTLILVAGFLLWAGCVAAAFCGLQRYSATPGEQREPTLDAERVLSELRQPGRALMVMALHPRCPCSDASLYEMQRLLAEIGDSCDGVILWYHPRIKAAGWPSRPNEMAPGKARARVVDDPDGELSSALGALTSGHVTLVDASGRVRFTGGLTISRGHRGPSPGQVAIRQILGGEPPVATSAPVFGCSLEFCRPGDRT